jgi:hypothetical protein
MIQKAEKQEKDHKDTSQPSRAKHVRMQAAGDRKDHT